jgi:uncharacterized membrane protein
LTVSILLFMIISKDVAIPSIKIVSPQYVYLSILLVIISCLGSVLMNQYSQNIGNLLFWALVLITTTILLTKKDLALQTKTIMIFSISLSCLLNITSISSFLTGWDIFYEYSIASTTMSQGVWDINLGSNVNAMLSIAILAPSLSWIGNIDVLWILKLVYPIIFSLVPIGVFILASRMVNEKAGIMAALLFILIQGFLFEMPSIARQEIAELFLILIFMVAMVDDFTDFQKAALGLLFGFGLITSHYATTLLFIFLIILYSVIRLVFHSKVKPIFSAWHFATFLVIEITWLLYIGSQGVLGSLLQVVKSIYNAVVNELSFTSSVVADRVSSASSLLHTFGKVSYILMVVIVMIGVAYRLYIKRKNIDNYTCLAVAFGMLMVVSLTMSNFLVLFGDIRMISLLLILIGAMFYYGISLIFSLPLIKRHRNKMMHFAAAFIAIYLIFNSGLAYAITNDGPTSIALNNNLLAPEYTDLEITGAKWAQNDRSPNQPISADTVYRAVVGGFGWFNVDRDNKKIDVVDRGQLVFIGHRNIEELRYYTGDFDKAIFIDSLWDRSTVYSSTHTKVMLVDWNYVYPT